MRSLFVFTLFLAFVFAAHAQQSISIAGRKTIYTRPKPSMDYKKNFTVNYPKVRAATSALSRKIERTISYQRVFEFAVREELGELRWLEEADFEVKYNARGLLCIWLFITGSGAYPSSSSRTLVVSLSSGHQIAPTHVFIKQNEIVAKVREQQRTEIKNAIEELRKNPDRGDVDPADLFKETIFNLKDLNEFEIDEKGITFIYDYNFPHVIQAWQPEGRFTFPWREFAPFIKPNSPFAQFIVR